MNKKQVFRRILVTVLCAACLLGLFFTSPLEQEAAAFGDSSGTLHFTDNKYDAIDTSCRYMLGNVIGFDTSKSQFYTAPSRVTKSGNTSAVQNGKTTDGFIFESQGGDKYKIRTGDGYYLKRGGGGLKSAYLTNTTSSSSATTFTCKREESTIAIYEDSTWRYTVCMNDGELQCEKWTITATPYYISFAKMVEDTTVSVAVTGSHGWIASFSPDNFARDNAKGTVTCFYKNPDTVTFSFTPTDPMVKTVALNDSVIPSGSNSISVPMNVFRTGNAATTFKVVVTYFTGSSNTYWIYLTLEQHNVDIPESLRSVVGKKTKPATCTQPGLVDIGCQNHTNWVDGVNGSYAEPQCGYWVYNIEIPALGHDYYLQQTHNPTCTQAGWKDYRCHRCNETKREPYGEPLGHDFSVNVAAKAPTCTENGWNAYQKCSRCSAKQNYTEIPALGHDYVDHAGQAPTCTEPGWDVYQTCTRCDYNSYHALPAAGHKSGTEWQKNAEQHWHVCTECGEPTDAAAHVYLEGSTLCSVCGYAAEPQALDAKFYATCSFDERLAVNYYVPDSYLEGYSDVRFEVVFENWQGSIMTLTEPQYITGISATYNNMACWKFTFGGISAPEVGNRIYTVLCAEKDGVSYRSRTVNYAIGDYCYSMLKDGSAADAGLKKLCVNVLNYASAAQTYFNMNPDTLVSAKLTDAQKALAGGNVAVTAKVSKTAIAAEAKKLEKISAKVNMASAPELIFDLTLKSGVSASSLRVFYSYESLTGKKTVSGYIPVTDARGGNVYRVKLDGFASADMRQPVTVKVLEDDTPVYDIITYSLECYCTSMLGTAITDANRAEMQYLQPLCQQMMNYSNAAKEYFVK